MNAQQIIDEARSWKGVRWVHQGRSRLGIDCVGLIVCVAKAFNVRVKDQMGYPKLPKDYSLMNAVTAHDLDRHARDEAIPGSILLFKYMRFPQHCAIDCGDTFVHAYEGVGEVAEFNWSYKWNRRVVARYTFKGMEL